MKIGQLPTVNRILKREFEAGHAPVNELIKVQSRDPFKVLVTTILSARTKDETTAVVATRLFKTIRRPNDLEKLTQKQLERLILPIGFFRTKARHLRQLPGALAREFGGRVPATIDELCRLPGVGRKTANLVMTLAFDEPAICVDVHVHRISNRLGLVRTATPHETETALRALLPKRYWKSWNLYLVSFGQTVCLPRRPRCEVCPLRRYCDRVDVEARAATP